MDIPKPFPAMSNGREGLDNPAILLFGNRFITDQSPLELLVELLLVALSLKKLGDSTEISEPLPTVEAIKNWVEKKNVGPLCYAPKARLSLKLFALSRRHRHEGSAIRRFHSRHSVGYRTG